MRAREPDIEGYVDRGGVKIAYEVFGDGPVTVLFFPADVITHSRSWKGQVPYLARHFRVVTVDPRGNGRSDRPHDQESYDDLTFVGDAVAVLDELSIDRAVLVGVCVSAWQSLVCAALHPDRVQGVVAIGPWAFDDTPPRQDPAEKAAYFRDHSWPEYAEWFLGTICNDPHSSKLVEDMVSFACDQDGVPQGLKWGARRHPAGVDEAAEMLESITCPVLVVHGSEDLCQARGCVDTIVEHARAELLVLDGAGHLPMGRDPVVVNHAIKDFVDRVAGTPRAVRHWKRGPARRPRLLYLSSPIGLGHVRRDLAIAQALREERPDLDVQWLSQSPVTDFLERAGETVHPASSYLASESSHIESEAGEHDLHAFAAVRRMDEILVNNFMVFDELVTEEQFDLWVGDEAWDLDHFLHENPELKRAPFVWMTDFVGWMPMADGGEREAFLTSDWNAEMIEHVARFPRLRDRSVFVGDPDDVVDLPLGPGLPTARAWTEEHFDFTGYVMGERPESGDRPALRRRLGYGDDDVVCLVSVGGSGVGRNLLRRVAESYDAARRRVPGLRMVMVTGPRIDPGSLDVPVGVEVHGFLPDLDLHHAACDIAVVQGGLSTTMELTASGRPFLYFPLGHHFEQQVHVRHRLDRHGAGRCMDFATARPDTIADALVEELARTPAYLGVPEDGARRAAGLVAELL